MKKIILSLLILLGIAIIVYCNFFDKINNSSPAALSPIDIISLNVPEPSGLHFDQKTKTLWTVSDENSTLYNLDLSGHLISKIVVDGEDLEGITVIKDSLLVVVLERDRAIIILDKKGKIQKRIDVDIKGDLNKGLEGISYNSIKNTFYVVNEKKPGVLIEIDSTGEIISRTKLTFASDYSGLCFDYLENILWIISDEDKAIFRCTTEGQLLEKYKVDIKQIEGISIDLENSVLYVISDPLEKLYIFELP